MSDDRMSEGSSRRVAATTNEMRELDMPELDFDRVEKQLMARVDAESRRRRVRSRGVMAVSALALAAAAVLVAGRTPSLEPTHGEHANAVNAVNEMGAGTLESGVVRCAGRTLAQGETLHRSDRVETTHAIVRSPGRVVYSLDSADVTVSETDRPIILSLTSGAVEAQVDKVPSGEAFAVDAVSGDNVVRIAVHGTHLRVARDGNHVVLDLTEGIVNVGHPPKSGSTYGTLVTAPAHVELDVDALETSFTMTKDPARVRAANDLSRAHVSAANDPPSGHVMAASQEPVHVVDVRPSKPLVIAPVVAQQEQPQPQQTQPPSVSAPLPAPVEPKTAVVNAVTQCVRDNVAAPQNGSLTIMTQLNLRVGDDGSVQATRFEPPLDPAVQMCAANAFKTIRFAQPGAVLIPITIER